MNEMYLDETFRKLWANKDPFTEIDLIVGETFRQVKSRRTICFSVNGNKYFAKIHHGTGWKEICKNLLQGKSTILGAENEWAALNKLKALGIPTMKICAFGSRGINPARIDSFIVTEDLNPAVSLEDYCRAWPKQPPEFSIKLALIRRLAYTSRVMHTNGMNHRDYYICHFLLDTSNGVKNITVDSLNVYLIDLHRAQIRKKTPYRWVIKDLAGLWFSAMDIGLSRNDRLRFILEYTGGKLRDELNKNKKFWQDVNNTATSLYKKEFGKLPEKI